MATNLIDSVLLAIATSLDSLISYIPNLLGAIIVLVIGWFIAGFLKVSTLRILDIVQLEPFAEKVGLSKTLKRVGATITAPEMIAELVKWATFLIFVNPAAEALGLSQLNIIIIEVLGYIPNVLVAVLILMFGVIFSDITAGFIKGTAEALDTNVAAALATLSRYAIVVFAFLAALSQLGIAANLIATLFTGFVAMLAIAGGLAFGLGGKDLAAELLEGLRNSLQENRKKD